MPSSNFERRKLESYQRPTHYFRYYVNGDGRFPADMLRYDNAWLADNEAVMDYDRTGIRRSIRIASHREPTADRWASFGWTVTYAKEV